jgi:hypothetical protein
MNNISALVLDIIWHVFSITCVKPNIMCSQYEFKYLVF